ncbi:MAG: GGDEF domain-containing protein [Oscillospiraceae bacterium]|nr:GGDEF domain-containing protein [Oscillospiraceae bacterium]
MKNTVKKRMMLSLFAVLVLTFSVIMTVFYISFTGSIKKDEFISGEAAASFAAVEVNGDKSKSYITTRKTDSTYQDVMRDLLIYTHDSTVSRISVISYGNTVGYYIYDTDGKTLGTKVAYDDYSSSIKPQLIECRESWNVTRGMTNYTYRPVRTNDDLAVAYIIVESAVVNDELPMVMIMVGAVSLVILAGISWLLVYFLRRSVFIPIETFASAAAAFAGSESRSNLDDDFRRKFETGRTDEIGHLGQSLISMMNVINHSRDDISTAIFDATHDGMTKAFNKRHYENKVQSFRNCSSLLVIYFDVNNLKLINDTLGHERGDYVIKKAAEYINDISFEDSMCFRMGGDEFLLVTVNRSYRDMISLVNRLDADCPVILSAETDSVKCSCAYGYAYAKGNYVYEQLLAEAEENMYRKKYEIKQQLNMPER